jgi:hypothetical protein
MMGVMIATHTTNIVRGRMLRYAMVLLLDEARRPMTVPEIVAGLAEWRLEVEGRASKVIPDAMRWEVRRGRVRRAGRGRYVLGHLAKSTRHWMRKSVALTRTEHWNGLPLGRPNSYIGGYD